MNLSVWRDVRSWNGGRSGSRDVIVGLRDGNRIWRVSPDTHLTTILSDHKNLTYFKTAQKLNRQQARWHLTLSEYDIKLIHVPGKQMVQSDALSQQPDLCPDKDTDNEDKILLPDTMFVRLINTKLRDLISTNKTRPSSKPYGPCEVANDYQ